MAEMAISHTRFVTRQLGDGIPLFSLISTIMDADQHILYEGKPYSNRNRPKDRGHVFDLDPSLRRAVIREPVIVKHTGPWYYQDSVPSCTAWSVANSALVLGIKPNMTYIRHMSHLATKDEQSRGLSIQNAAEYVNGLIDFGLHLSPVSYRYMGTDSAVWGEVSGSLYKINETCFDRPYRFSKLKEADSELLVQMILACLDRRLPVIAAVRSEDYYDLEGEHHAICLAGYRITPEGLLDFQVIDSNCGIVWVPHERIMRWNISHSLHVAKRADQPLFQKTDSISQTVP